MGWEERNGSRYYYRKVREGDTVRSEYVGAGQVAQLVAQLDEATRGERDHKHRKWKDQKRVEAEITRRVCEVQTQIQQLTHAVLIASGYHTHKGQWRKTREHE